MTAGDAAGHADAPRAAPEGEAPDLSVVILSWNTKDLLLRCLETVGASLRPPSFEVIVVDNASRDGSADAVAARFPQAQLIRNPRNDGYARGNNLGIRLARGRHVLLLNSDTEPAPAALRELVRFLDANPNYGAASARLWNVDGTIQRACMRFPTLATALFYDGKPGRAYPNNWFVRRHFYRDFDHIDSRDVEQPPGGALPAARGPRESWAPRRGIVPFLQRCGPLPPDPARGLPDSLPRRCQHCSPRRRFDLALPGLRGRVLPKQDCLLSDPPRCARRVAPARGDAMARTRGEGEARGHDAPGPERDAAMRGVDDALATALRRDPAGAGVISELADPTHRVS